MSLECANNKLVPKIATGANNDEHFELGSYSFLYKEKLSAEDIFR